MTTSLLSLPNELLVLVVDQALGEYAPRSYKQRQQTACALALVNKRIGAIASDKLLEAVHIWFGLGHEEDATPRLDQVPHPTKVRALHHGSRFPHECALDFTSFAAICDLRLTHLVRVHLDDIAELPVHLIGEPIYGSRLPSDRDGLVRDITAGALSKEAFREKALFDLLLDVVDLLPDRAEDVKHLRVHVTALGTRYDSACAERIRDLADVLDTAFPHLETLYLPLALDTSHVMLHRHVGNALTSILRKCARRRIVIVFEQDLDADKPGEDRAAPHFEARCRRIKAERAAAAAASATTSGARAAR
ncbi:hypothetical protein JCM9279_006581 [Rhodotorula babjevae]